MAQGSYPGGPQPPLPPQPAYVAAPPKDYVGPAVLTLVLYYVGFWLVGLIVNIVYLADAARYRRETQRPASGVGCLWALLIFHVLLPIVAGVLLVVTGLGALILAAIAGSSGG